VGYIAFASAKGSPGVTTAVAALAASWPSDRGLLVAELDPAGGDLAVRYDLPAEPGLVTLAAAARRDLDPETLFAHTQALPGVVGAAHATRRILPAPVAVDQATASLAALRGRLSGVLASAGIDVLVDCGRLDLGSPVQRVATEADLLVVVARPVVAEVHHLATRLDGLEPRGLSLLLIGDRPYSVEEVAQAVGASPLGTLPDDARAAAALTVGDPHAVRVVRRSGLLRGARAIAERLASWLTPAPPPAPSPPPLPAPPPPPPAAAASRPLEPAPAEWPR
jgi:MinD-like ATPase involved in chromosome partitioning or flagellar assembly